MSHLFFDFYTLENGTKEMVESIKKTYSEMINKKVLPPVQPGFLRTQLEQSAPEKGKPIKQVIKQTEQKILPGVMLWQSPKYFGYYPSSIAVTNVIAEMFATTYHTPGFNFAVSPSHTELQNIQMDWTAKALGLPDEYLLSNSGGGIINNSTTESVFVTVHAAKRTKMTELQINQIDPRILKFVGYYSEIAHNGGQRGLLLKQIYYRRAVRVNYSEEVKNYVIDVSHFQELVKKDIQDGLIPFWFGATYGSTLSAAIDLTPEVVEICNKHKIWINVDAAYLGSTWICPQFRPSQEILSKVDSICINFSKMLLLGTGGSLMYVRNKKQLNSSFSGTTKFSFYENKFTGKQDVIDYKDWIIGLGRRNNSIKFYFMFEHYGLQQLRKLIYDTQEKADNLQKEINNDREVFQLFCKQFGLICFRVRGKNDRVDDELTKKVIDRVKNIDEGFMSPGYFKGAHLLRIVIGNNHSDMKTILAYYLKIKQIAFQEQQKSKDNQNQ